MFSAILLLLLLPSLPTAQWGTGRVAVELTGLETYMSGKVVMPRQERFSSLQRLRLFRTPHIRTFVRLIVGWAKKNGINSKIFFCLVGWQHSFSHGLILDNGKYSVEHIHAIISVKQRHYRHSYRRKRHRPQNISPEKR